MLIRMCPELNIRNDIFIQLTFLRRLVSFNVRTSTVLITMVMSLLLSTSVPRVDSHCPMNFSDYRTRRLTALRFQILTKLGLVGPPEENGPTNISQNVLSLYNQTVSLIEEQYIDKNNLCGSEASKLREDKYFAKVPVIFEVDANWEYHKEDYFISRKRYARFYKFNISSLYGRDPNDEIREAIFRLYQIRNDEQHMAQTISVHKLLLHGNDLKTHHVFTKTFDPQHDGPISIDVTEVVRSWVRDPDSNYGFEVGVECASFQVAQPWTTLHVQFGDPRNSYTDSFQERGDRPAVENNSHGDGEEKHPKLIVMTSGNYSIISSTEGHSRPKRAFTTNGRCDDTVASCCKREFYVNFKRDLDWYWVRQPKGFWPNFCAGNCPFISADRSMYRMMLMVHRDTNPDGSPSPCCSPKSFKPLTVLYYDSNQRPQISILDNVVVDSCRCS